VMPMPGSAPITVTLMEPADARASNATVH